MSIHSAYKPQPRTWVDPAEQKQANEYWAQREVKKWVVLFSRGPAYRREYCEVFVSARNRDGALSVGRGAAVTLNRAWARTCSATVRLATYIDLGCTRAPA